jgi:hypothetical protein
MVMIICWELIEHCRFRPGGEGNRGSLPGYFPKWSKVCQNEPKSTFPGLYGVFPSGEMPFADLYGAFRPTGMPRTGLEAAFRSGEMRLAEPQGASRWTGMGFTGGWVRLAREGQRGRARAPDFGGSFAGRAGRLAVPASEAELGRDVFGDPEAADIEEVVIEVVVLSGGLGRFRDQDRLLIPHPEGPPPPMDGGGGFGEFGELLFVVEVLQRPLSEFAAFPVVNDDHPRSLADAEMLVHGHDPVAEVIDEKLDGTALDAEPGSLAIILGRRVQPIGNEDHLAPLVPLLIEPPGGDGSQQALTLRRGNGHGSLGRPRVRRGERGEEVEEEDEEEVFHFLGGKKLSGVRSDRLIVQ